MANRLNWTPGREGKGNWYKNGDISTWNVDDEMNPHHHEVATEEMNDPDVQAHSPGFFFYINPRGGIHDGGIGFNNQTPKTDDQILSEVITHDPRYYNAMGEENNFDIEPDITPREELSSGGYGHAQNLLDILSKIAADESGWADFHTELKLPRGVRQRIRRWADRLKWPEGSELADARTYHITILSMDEYDEDFAKWARKEMRGRYFTFKTTGMDIFADEHVVLRMECPEWTDLVRKWTDLAEEKGLEPHKFEPPKAHVTIGKSPEGKWPQGVPDPHIKFDARQFNINKNAASLDEEMFVPGTMDRQPITVIPHNWEESRYGKDPEWSSFMHEQGRTPFLYDPERRIIHLGQPGMIHEDLYDTGLASNAVRRLHQGELNHLDNPSRFNYGNRWEHGEDAAEVRSALEDHAGVPFDVPVWHIDKSSMAVDPNFWRSWYSLPGRQFLYHGTTTDRLPHIMREGLVPWDQGRPSRDYVGDQARLMPRPNHVYTHEDPDMAQWYGEQTAKHSGGKPVILTVDPRKLNPANINPDEDSWVDYDQIYNGGGESPHALHERTFDPDKSRGEQAELAGYGDNPEHTQWAIEEHGPIAHRGPIPPEAIVSAGNLVFNRDAGRNELVPLPDWQRQSAVQWASGDGDEQTIADELRSWLQYRKPTRPLPPTQPPSLHHTDTDQFMPEVIEPASVGPHVDPPSKPYEPYNWADDGYEESPLNRVAGETRSQQLARAQALETKHGPDTSEIVHEFPDAWTVRKLNSYADAQREGELMGNCFQNNGLYSGIQHAIWEHHPEALNPQEFNDNWARIKNARPEEDPENFGHVPPNANLQIPITYQGKPWPIYSLRDPDNIPHLTDDRQEILGRHNIPPKDKYFDYMARWKPEWYVEPERRHLYEAATHNCPECGESIDGQICDHCGYDPTHADGDYEKSKANWYDRAWSSPESQPRMVPDQPMHWRDDHARDIKEASWHEI